MLSIEIDGPNISNYRSLGKLFFKLAVSSDRQMHCGG